MSLNCSICNASITMPVFKYSNDVYGKALCYQHQNELKVGKKAPIANVATNESNRLFVPLTQKGWTVESESYDGYKHVDLSIPKAKVDIEVDGQHHNYNSTQALSDVKRTFHSYMDGYMTIRIPNSLVNDQIRLDETTEYLDGLLKERVVRLEKEKRDDKIARMVKTIMFLAFGYFYLVYLGYL